MPEARIGVRGRPSRVGECVQCHERKGLSKKGLCYTCQSSKPEGLYGPMPVQEAVRVMPEHMMSAHGYEIKTLALSGEEMRLERERRIVWYQQQVQQYGRIMEWAPPAPEDEVEGVRFEEDEEDENDGW